MRRNNLRIFANWPLEPRGQFKTCLTWKRPPLGGWIDDSALSCFHSYYIRCGHWSSDRKCPFGCILLTRAGARANLCSSLSIFFQLIFILTIKRKTINNSKFLFPDIQRRIVWMTAYWLASHISKSPNLPNSVIVTILKKISFFFSRKINSLDKLF